MSPKRYMLLLLLFLSRFSFSLDHTTQSQERYLYFNDKSLVNYLQQYNYDINQHWTELSDQDENIDLKKIYQVIHNQLLQIFKSENENKNLQNKDDLQDNLLKFSSHHPSLEMNNPNITNIQRSYINREKKDLVPIIHSLIIDFFSNESAIFFSSHKNICKQSPPKLSLVLQINEEKISIISKQFYSNQCTSHTPKISKKSTSPKRVLTKGKYLKGMFLLGLLNTSYSYAVGPMTTNTHNLALVKNNKALSLSNSPEILDNKWLSFYSAKEIDANKEPSVDLVKKNNPWFLPDANVLNQGDVMASTKFYKLDNSEDDAREVIRIVDKLTFKSMKIGSRFQLSRRSYIVPNVRPKDFSQKLMTSKKWVESTNADTECTPGGKNEKNVFTAKKKIPMLSNIVTKVEFNNHENEDIEEFKNLFPHNLRPDLVSTIELSESQTSYLEDSILVTQRYRLPDESGTLVIEDNILSMEPNKASWIERPLLKKCPDSFMESSFVKETIHNVEKIRQFFKRNK